MTFPASMLALLSDVRPIPRQVASWTARCPVSANHPRGDLRPSLYLKVGITGVLMLHCNVCSAARLRGRTYLETVCRATRTEPWQWCRQPDPKTKKGRRAVAKKIVRTFPYVTEHGELAFEICRFDCGDAKSMARRPAKEGETHTHTDGGITWVWGYGSAEDNDPHPGLLYRLPELLGSNPDDLVCITEGEPDADTLAALGFVAVTNAFGAGQWTPAHAKWLAGRRCAIFEDNDVAGRHRTATIIGDLVCAGAAKLAVVRFTDLPEKSDVSDWLRLPQFDGADVATKQQAVIDRILASGMIWEPVRRAA